VGDSISWRTCYISLFGRDCTAGLAGVVQLFGVTASNRAGVLAQPRSHGSAPMLTVLNWWRNILAPIACGSKAAHAAE